MYKPTHEELEKLWFKKDTENRWITMKNPSWMIMYDEHLNIFSTTPLYIYPRNIDDMKTMVDLVYLVPWIFK